MANPTTTAQASIPVNTVAEVLGDAFDMIKEGVVRIRTIENPLETLDYYIVLKRALGVIYGLADALNRAGYADGEYVAERGAEMENKLDSILMERSVADICAGREEPRGPVNG